MAQRPSLTHLSSTPTIMINICEIGQGQLMSTCQIVYTFLSIFFKFTGVS